MCDLQEFSTGAAKRICGGKYYDEVYSKGYDEAFSQGHRGLTRYTEVRQG